MTNEAAERLREWIADQDDDLREDLLSQALAAEREAVAAEERERIHEITTSMRDVVAVERNGKHEGIPHGWLNTIDQWAAILDAEVDR